jgi:hypothetical protein
MAAYKEALREQDYQGDTALLVWWWFKMILSGDVGK